MTEYSTISAKRIARGKLAQFRQKPQGRHSRLWLLFIVSAICAAMALTFAALAGTTPSSGTVSPTNTVITFTGGPFAVSNPSDPLGNTPPICTDATCGQFALTVNIPLTDTNLYNARVSVGWTNSGTTTQGSQQSDFDLYIYKPDFTGTLVAKSTGGPASNPEVGTFSATSGNYTIYAVPYDVSPTVTFNGTVTLSKVGQPSPSPTPTPSATPTPLPSTPRFFNYADPYNDEWGEPSLGINYKSGNVMYISALATLRIGFNDSTSPARANWADKSFLSTSVVTLDPILFTDSQLGRTFATQLVSGLGYGLGCSLTAFTDDDGESWIQSEGCGLPTSGADHETVGGGLYAAPLTGTPAYSHVVYYCSQAEATAFCARSDDGGLTFGPGVPMYTLVDCVGIHGHVKIGPDGTVYVPDRSCNGQQAMAVSHDNGITWDLKKAPQSHSGVWDPSIGIGADGTVYFGYDDGGKTARMAIYNPKTDQWISDSAVGGSTPFTGVAFPAVVAGDSDRAAFAFLGTTTPGTPFGSGTDFTGAWHLYVATTFDHGASYVLSDATPADSVQRGNICDQGSACPGSPVNTRNLLDFMDVQLDQKGRIVVAYADGCTTAGCLQGRDVSGPTGTPDGVVDSYDNDHRALSTIARQSGGRGLFSQYDSELYVATPAAPQLVASANGASVNLSWSTPDDGGYSITGYKIYRGVGTGPDVLLASISGDVNSYTDTSGGANYYYAVQAINANGAGALSPRVSPTPLETPCLLPGLTVAGDPGDNAPNTPPVPQVDFQSVSIAEPYFSDGSQKLVFTLKLGGGGSLPPNSQWYVIWDRPKSDPNYSRDYVAMRTDLSGNPSFEYGRINYAIQYTNPQPNQGNLPTRLGSPDAASYDAAKGIVQITVSRSLLDNDDNIGIGKMLNTIEGRSFLGRNDYLPINQNLSSDFTGDGTYTVVGNNACQLAPAAPTNLTANVSSKGSIALTWTDNSNNETGFSIERSTAIDTGYVEIATVAANATNYTDRSVARKTTYYYRVRAVRSNANSGYSNIAAARIK